MFDWLISFVPWWLWLLLAATVVGAVWRVWGWQGAVAAAGGLMAIMAYGKGRDEGRRSQEAQQHRARLEAARKRKEIEDEVDQLGPADVDREFDRWMRDDPER